MHILQPQRTQKQPQGAAEEVPGLQQDLQQVWDAGLFQNGVLIGSRSKLIGRSMNTRMGITRHNLAKTTKKLEGAIGR